MFVGVFVNVFVGVGVGVGQTPKDDCDIPSDAPGGFNQIFGYTPLTGYGVVELSLEYMEPLSNPELNIHSPDDIANHT